jgi:hypothetical protein
MWFPTKPKVLVEIDRMMVQFKAIDGRIKFYEDQHRMAVSAGFYSEAPELQEMREVHDELVSVLSEVRFGVRLDMIDAWTIAKQLKPINGAISNLERVLDETDKIQKAAKTAFRNRIGDGGDDQSDSNKIEMPDDKRFDELADMASQLMEAEVAFVLAMKMADYEKKKNAPNN